MSYQLLPPGTDGPTVLQDLNGISGGVSQLPSREECDEAENWLSILKHALLAGAG